MFSKKVPPTFVQGISTLFISFRPITPSCRYYSTDLISLRRAIGRGQIQPARQAYEALPSTCQPDRQVIRKLLLLARHGKRRQDLDFIQTILYDMKHEYHIHPQHFEYHALIYAYGIQQLPEKAYQVLHQMRQDNVIPNLYTYNTLLGCYKRTNYLEGAEKILQEMTSYHIEPDTVTYNTFFHLLLRTSNYDRVFDLYQRMKQTCKPDIYTYSTVLDAATKASNYSLGSEIIDLVLQQPEKLDIHILNNILRFKADTDLNNVLDFYYQLPTLFPHLQPDRITFNILLDACLKRSNPAKAYMLFRDMKNHGIKPDIVTYGTFIDAESRLGHLKDALQLFQDMCESSISPTVRILTSLVNIASSKSTTSNDLDTLLGILKKYPLKLDTKAYNGLMYGLAIHGRSNQAQQLYDTVFRHRTCQPDIATFTHLILAYIHDDYMDDALEIYYTLREHHKKSRDTSNVKMPIQLDTTFYSTLISSLSTPKCITTTTTDDEYDSSPRLLTAMSLLNDMRKLRIQPTLYTYTSLLHACGQYRDRYVLHQVHQHIKVDMYLDPDIGMYNALMDAYNRTEEGDVVLDIWDTISFPNTYLRPDQTSVSIVLDSCGHNGYFSKAQTIWLHLKKTGFSFNTNNYNSYIECLCRMRGREGWDQAYTLIKQEMSSRSVHGKVTMDEKTINTLISFAKKKGFNEEEVNTLLQWKKSLFK